MRKTIVMILALNLFLVAPLFAINRAGIAFHDAVIRSIGPDRRAAAETVLVLLIGDAFAVARLRRGAAREAFEREFS